MPPSNLTGDVRSADLDLVGRIRAGDGPAFEQLYKQHSTRLYNLASRMMGAHGEADDLLQDIFLLAYRKLGSFRGESSLGTWLYRLAMNHCLDVLRNRQTRMGQQTDSLDEPDAAPVAARVPVVGAVSRIDLERAIATLPPACRAAFLLHDVEGLRPPGSRRDARDFGRHLEVAGAQGADADSFVPRARLEERKLTLTACGRRPRLMI